MSEDKNMFVERAKMAEQADRYDDMVESMRRVAAFNEDLSVEERNLLSVAYKNVVGARRSAWRVISNIDEKAESDSTKKRLAAEYQAQIKEELHKWCDQVLTLLNDTLIPNATGSDNRESQVFYLKMKGDYYRYLVEVTTDEDDRNKEYRNNSKKAYDEATELASELSSANPIRLGLALNFSVFYYEIENNPEEACKIAKESFDEAIVALDNLDQEPYKDCTLIMQLLRDNLTLWTSPSADDAQDD